MCHPQTRKLYKNIMEALAKQNLQESTQATKRPSLLKQSNKIIRRN